MSLTRPPHAGMRHVALNVLDLALVESFYVDLLGFNVEWRPDQENVYLCSGVDNLALHVVENTGDKAQVLAHTGIIVDEIEHVDAWYNFLLENKVKMAAAPRTHRDGARSFYCHDPEGTVVQVLYHPPLSKG
ncbi:VOC family protein [Arenicella xantha]|uniref:Glyoxalase/bleomycin resistance protein/dioxygenase superfamily protein n=1 Tax=Arenicella xantha TaxID=644221 RepID=A0A395JS28_9GAMM|nr:VOC family protein [Arenicella xantha]RBP53385.1 glyoxalase/bleomycin resistance protein/dioxygenase superfamily protein [Arenicella xantha]